MHTRSLHCAALLLALLAAPDGAAQEIGRLFSTPEERAGLDRMRQAGPRAPLAEAGTAPMESTPVVVPVEGVRLIVVDGVVTRSGSSARTTWIDAVPHRDGGKRSVAVLPGEAGDASVVIKLPSGKQVRLKAGQRVDAVSGRIREGYEPDAPRR